MNSAIIITPDPPDAEAEPETLPEVGCVQFTHVTSSFNPVSAVFPKWEHQILPLLTFSSSAAVYPFLLIKHSFESRGLALFPLSKLAPNIIHITLYVKITYFLYKTLFPGNSRPILVITVAAGMKAICHLTVPSGSPCYV